MSREPIKSWEIHHQQRRYLAGSSSTSSKRPVFEGVEPAVILRGKGCRVWDADGNEYIDYRCALGPVSLGYAVPEINEAISAQLAEGIIFGHPHPLEGEVAELLVETIPCAEKARFLKTGGEAVAACIKIARHATGRNHILQCGYNGWLNTLAQPAGTAPGGIAASAPQKGVPTAIGELHHSMPWNDMAPWEELFQSIGNDIAAVVIATDYADIEKAQEFLPAIRELTRKSGALMIMDEIVMGFRLALGGAHDYFGVMPDLAVFAKGMSNGMPLSAYVGTGDLVEFSHHIGISSTFGGETLSLAAARRVIAFYREKNVIGHLWRVGTMLWEGLSELFNRHGMDASVEGLPVCPRISFGDSGEMDEFIKGCYKNGVSLYQVPYVNFSHGETDIEESLTRMSRAIDGMKKEQRVE